MNCLNSFSVDGRAGVDARAGTKVGVRNRGVAESILEPGSAQVQGSLV